MIKRIIFNKKYGIMTLKRVKEQHGGHLDRRECPKFEIFQIKRNEKSRKSFDIFVWRTKARKKVVPTNKPKKK